MTFNSILLFLSFSQVIFYIKCANPLIPSNPVSVRETQSFKEAPIVGSLGGYTAPNSGDQGRIKRLVRVPGEILYNFLPSGGIAIGLNNIIPASASITFNGYDARGTRLYDATYGNLPGRLVDPILNIFPSRMRGAQKNNPGIYEQLNKSFSKPSQHINKDLEYWTNLAKNLTDPKPSDPSNDINNQATDTQNPVINVSEDMMSRLISILSSENNLVNSSSTVSNDALLSKTLSDLLTTSLDAPFNQGLLGLGLGSSIFGGLADIGTALSNTSSLAAADLLNNVLTPDWRVASDWKYALYGGIYDQNQPTLLSYEGRTTPTLLGFSGDGFVPVPSLQIDPRLPPKPLLLQMRP